MDVSEAKRLKSLEDENVELERLLADATLDDSVLEDLLGRNGDARRRSGSRRPCDSREHDVSERRACSIVGADDRGSPTERALPARLSP